MRKATQSMHQGVVANKSMAYSKVIGSGIHGNEGVSGKSMINRPKKV